MANPLRHTALLCSVSLLGLFSSEQAAALPPEAPVDYLAVTAWMDLAGGNANGVIVEVNVNGTKDWGRPDADGRVDLLLPADAVALIQFRKPGLITKTVSVDTHNMRDGSFKGKRSRISFGVKMASANSKEEMAYAGPVGSIAFDAATGDLVVKQDQHLVPIRQQKVEF